MNIVVLDAATLGDDCPLNMLDGLGQVTVWQNTPPELVSQRIRNAEIVILNKVRANAQTLSEAHSLQLICVTATGYDNIDLDYCKSHNIGVSNVRGYSQHSVAQVTTAMVFSLVSHLQQYSRYVRTGAYTKSGIHNRLEPVYHEISGMTWGMIGMGNIGKVMASVAAAFGCRTLVCKKHPDPAYPCVDIDTLCRESDLITIHAPLNEGTKGLISRERIRLMKDGVILVNTARGAIIDEAAVADAVLSGKIGGFGTDVYPVEPMEEDSPLQRLCGLDQVIMTPHMAWGAYEARVRCMDEVAENIRAFQRGELRNRLDR